MTADEHKRIAQLQAEIRQLEAKAVANHRAEFEKTVKENLVGKCLIIEMQHTGHGPSLLALDYSKAKLDFWGTKPDDLRVYLDKIRRVHVFYYQESEKRNWWPEKIERTGPTRDDYTPDHLQRVLTEGSIIREISKADFERFWKAAREACTAMFELMKHGPVKEPSLLPPHEDPVSDPELTPLPL